jgi:hypothetical protein
LLFLQIKICSFSAQVPPDHFAEKHARNVQGSAPREPPAPNGRIRDGLSKHPGGYGELAECKKLCCRSGMALQARPGTHELLVPT